MIDNWQVVFYNIEFDRGEFYVWTKDYLKKYILYL